MSSLSKKTAELMANVPAHQRTWIVTLDQYMGVCGKPERVTARIDAMVAEIEANGWVLTQVMPATHGAANVVAGDVGTTMVGVFRRA